MLKSDIMTIRGFYDMNIADSWWRRLFCFVDWKNFQNLKHRLSISKLRVKDLSEEFAEWQFLNEQQVDKEDMNLEDSTEVLASSMAQRYVEIFNNFTIFDVIKLFLLILAVKLQFHFAMMA